MQVCKSLSPDRSSGESFSSCLVNGLKLTALPILLGPLPFKPDLFAYNSSCLIGVGLTLKLIFTFTILTGLRNLEWQWLESKPDWSIYNSGLVFTSEALADCLDLTYPEVRQAIIAAATTIGTHQAILETATVQLRPLLLELGVDLHSKYTAGLFSSLVTAGVTLKPG